MAKNKRFTSDIHRIYDNNEEIACADTMDDAEILVDRLNEQEERIRELEKENKTLKDTIDGLTGTLAHTIDITPCGDVDD